jgi:hypothetical protein
VALPALILGHNPTRRIICVSYSQELAVKHANDCRTVMSSEWYRQLFPNTKVDPAKNTETEVMATRRGFRLSTSVGGTLTGRGGNPIEPQGGVTGMCGRGPDPVGSGARCGIGTNMTQHRAPISELESLEQLSRVIAGAARPAARDSFCFIYA